MTEGLSTHWNDVGARQQKRPESWSGQIFFPQNTHHRIFDGLLLRIHIILLRLSNHCILLSLRVVIGSPVSQVEYKHSGVFFSESFSFFCSVLLIACKVLCLIVSTTSLIKSSPLFLISLFDIVVNSRMRQNDQNLDNQLSGHARSEKVNHYHGRRN